MSRKLQVFISSTYTDLLDERQTAVEAVLKAGHIPAGMELFAAGDRKQLDVIKQWIIDSDVYCLILGARYGTIEPVSGLSYTEVEYDFAVQQGKPYFALVLNNALIQGKRDAGHIEVDKLYNQLAAFREKVGSKQCEFIRDLGGISAAIMHSMRSFDSDPRAIGWIRANAQSSIQATAPRVAASKRMPLIELYRRAEQDDWTFADGCNDVFDFAIGLRQAAADGTIEVSGMLQAKHSSFDSLVISIPKKYWMENRFDPLVAFNKDRRGGLAGIGSDNRITSTCSQKLGPIQDSFINLQVNSAQAIEWLASEAKSYLGMYDAAHPRLPKLDQGREVGDLYSKSIVSFLSPESANTNARVLVAFRRHLTTIYPGATFENLSLEDPLIIRRDEERLGYKLVRLSRPGGRSVRDDLHSAITAANKDTWQLTSPLTAMAIVIVLENVDQPPLNDTELRIMRGHLDDLKKFDPTIPRLILGLCDGDAFVALGYFD